MMLQMTTGQDVTATPCPASGEGGIRTPGTLRHAGFQDRCIRPLCHLSKLFYVLCSNGLCGITSQFDSLLPDSITVFVENR